MVLEVAQSVFYLVASQSFAIMRFSVMIEHDRGGIHFHEQVVGSTGRRLPYLAVDNQGRALINMAGASWLNVRPVSGKRRPQ